MAEVRLIGAVTSLFCTRIEWALKLKGVEYEYLEEDVRNKSKMLLEYNPIHKKIPVLVHRGKPIAESLVILEYIDETWKHVPLLPADPYDKAMARFWAAFIDDKCLYGAWWACVKEGEEKEKEMETALESFKIFEKQIEGKKFFSGSEQIGYLDLAAGWIPLWLNALEEVGGMKLLAEEKFPYLHSWSQRFTEIPLIKESLPPREKIIDYFSGGVSYMRSLESK